MTRAISFKIIKPKPLNTKAMDATWIQQANKIGILMAQDYSGITKNWSNGGVRFKHKVKSTRDRIQISVNADNPWSKQAKIWGYLDKGTKAHMVKPKRAKALAFPGGYKAGSRPNSMFVGASSSGGLTAYSRGHMVAGIKPRNWSKLMQKKWKLQMQKEGAFISTMLARASGHKMK